MLGLGGNLSGEADKGEGSELAGVRGGGSARDKRAEEGRGRWAWGEPPSEKGPGSSCSSSRNLRWVFSQTQMRQKNRGHAELKWLVCK